MPSVVKVTKPVSRVTHSEVSMKPGTSRTLVVTIDREHLELRERGTRQPPVRVPYDRLYKEEVSRRARINAGLRP